MAEAVIACVLLLCLVAEIAFLAFAVHKIALLSLRAALASWRLLLFLGKEVALERAATFRIYRLARSWRSVGIKIRKGSDPVRKLKIERSRTSSDLRVRIQLPPSVECHVQHYIVVLSQLRSLSTTILPQFLIIARAASPVR